MSFLFKREGSFFHLLISFSTEQNNSNGKRAKVAGSGDENGALKGEVEESSASGSKKSEKSGVPSEPPKQDYIHVRARRGQATDSHSLAERVSFLQPILKKKQFF